VRTFRNLNDTLDDCNAITNLGFAVVSLPITATQAIILRDSTKNTERNPLQYTAHFLLNVLLCENDRDVNIVYKNYI